MFSSKQQEHRSPLLKSHCKLSLTEKRAIDPDQVTNAGMRHTLKTLRFRRLQMPNIDEIDRTVTASNANPALSRRALFFNAAASWALGCVPEHQPAGNREDGAEGGGLSADAEGRPELRDLCAVQGAVKLHAGRRRYCRDWLVPLFREEELKSIKAARDPNAGEERRICVDAYSGQSFSRSLCWRASELKSSIIESDFVSIADSLCVQSGARWNKWISVSSIHVPCIRKSARTVPAAVPSAEWRWSL